MISGSDALCAAVVLTPALAATGFGLVRNGRQADALNRSAGIVCAVIMFGAALIGITHASTPIHGSWYILDGGAGLFLGVVALVGLATALTSPAYLRDHRRAGTGALRSRQLYYVGVYLFWGALAAIPVIDNLALAWIVVEATTAASALLVAFSGARSAFEAGWKYLVLTSVGLTVALLGIVVIYAGASGGSGSIAALDWGELSHRAAHLNHQTALTAFALIVAGLATKVGWAPVHNWLPDAHSEAPPPVSALLSAALLPAVALIVWRLDLSLRPAIDPHATQAILIAFGLASLAVAVPFLWKSLAWKRFLAYSSLEHMGVIALGIGFQNRYATAGVLLHVAGHAIAKALGFSLTIPLLRCQPSASKRRPRGIASVNRPLAAGMLICLGALAAVPPSPLFFSEVLILFGGIASGHLLAVVLAAVLLAMGFVGVAHLALESVSGSAPDRRSIGRRTRIWTASLAGAATVLMLALCAVAYGLPHATVSLALTAGLR